ncbi:hypothetical protein [Streptomyces sp. NPDC004270]
MDSGRRGRGRAGGRFGGLGAGVVRRRRRRPPLDAVTVGDGVAVDSESVPVPFATAVGPEFTDLGDAAADTHTRAQADRDRTTGADHHLADAPPDDPGSPAAGAHADPDHTTGTDRHRTDAPPHDPGSPAAGAHADHEAGPSPHTDAQTVRDPAPADLAPALAVPHDDAAEPSPGHLAAFAETGAHDSGSDDHRQ